MTILIGSGALLYELCGIADLTPNGVEEVHITPQLITFKTSEIIDGELVTANFTYEIDWSNRL